MTKLKKSIPSESECRLQQIAAGASVTTIYKGESRPWFDLVDESQIEKAIAQDPPSAMASSRWTLSSSTRAYGWSRTSGR